MKIQQRVFCLLSILICNSGVTHAYEICTEANSYLEAGLPPTSYQPSNLLLPIACIETAQLSLPLTGYYGHCDTNNGRPERTHPRPCISQTYVESVAQSLDDATSCFGYDPRWFFSVLTLESGLHINAVGGAADAGLGQLTTSAIREVNLNALSRAIRHATTSPLPACQRILSSLYEGDSSVANRCSFLKVPENPGHNLVFSLLLLQRNQAHIAGYFNRLGIVLPDRVDVPRVKQLLSMVAYNSGSAGIAATLKAYVDVMGADLSDEDFDFENRSPRSFVTFVHKNFPIADIAVRKRISRYMGHILASSRSVEKKLNRGEGTCSDQALLYPRIHTLGTAPRTLIHDEDAVRAATLEHFARLAKATPSTLLQDMRTCSQRQADFEYAFVPKGLELKDLPAAIQEVYARQCR